jgi:hypothetical protein
MHASMHEASRTAYYKRQGSPARPVDQRNLPNLVLDGNWRIEDDWGWQCGNSRIEYNND